MHKSSNDVVNVQPAIIARIERLEKQNRRLRIIGSGLLAIIGIGAVAGFQAPPN